MGEHATMSATQHLSMPQRIEHVQLIHPDDLGRLAANGIVASLQPVHLLTDWPTADRVWGRRARYAYAFRSLLERSTLLAFGSDAPVAPLNPLLGIYAAVTRQDEHGQPADGWYPEERLTVAEAIYGYTMGPARLAGKEHLQGSLVPGKWADLVVLSENLFEVPPREIAKVEVETTIFNGEVVYQRT
jgi:predicted amidohydrolase YtcJ